MTVKAKNLNFAKTIKERVRRNSVVHQSLPDFTATFCAHKRSGSLRPLPTVPIPPPPRSHIRRPTGPRELPNNLLNVVGNLVSRRAKEQIDFDARRGCSFTTRFVLFSEFDDGLYCL